MFITLKEQLQNIDKTMYWLSKETGISQNAIGKLANNKSTSITFDNLQKICIALNCTPSDILQID
ncbi:helix-turn-helix domain-containing protein [Clostridium botulinum]|uniref:helix-turn-helix domain-containing protein n=1 Tax=Clostridium botulinum TaxID=1491 RepID=UPI00069A16DC|nr:helix-turn-helix transcriptional regulator [Clostridium botulinum]KOA73890.1 Cro/Cl family transcriptional regulator [Clostridium botulinum]KOA94051.1 Cro/Cl family transcriptional regulator [Clostridium botulinum]KOC32880.1 Cro/Cl family transcriptional regulator [Clostridium botulinum]MCD3202321.1 helix-turn-helix transcriptional regulator [Clostridium botulinum C/D]MCD3223662.1 helix-turn-helix transcriptional regulator [Clostridium botulinum C/D]